MNMAANCLLCFNEVAEENASSGSSKILDLCSKFLHSLFIPKTFVNQSSHQIFPFCSKCFESVLELVDINDQVEFYQKRISEIVLMLSLGILHRRGQTNIAHSMTPNDVHPKKKIIEFDISSLPNLSFLNPSPTFQTLVSPAKNGPSFKNAYDVVYEEEVNDSHAMSMVPQNIPELRLEDIKCEVSQPDLLDDNFDSEDMNINYTINEPLSDNEIAVTHEDLIAPENQIENRTIPTVKIQKLQFHGGERFVVIENETNRPKNISNQSRRKKHHAVWNKCDLGNSHRIERIENIATKSASESCSADLESLPNIPITTASTPVFTISTSPPNFTVSTSPPDVQISEKNGIPNNSTAMTPSLGLINVGDCHSSSSLNEKPFKCNLCFERFKMFEELQVHTIIHQVKQDLHYNCERCHVKFETEESLIKHAKIHGREREFSCEICGNKFATLNGMLKHTKFHTDKREEPYQCELCKKTFSTKKKFLVHERMHRGDPRYKCDFCGMMFSQPSSLIRHKIVHSQLYGERPYICKICQIIFSTRKSLLNHVRLHTGDHRPYKCDYCEMRFKGHSTLVRHVRVHTGEKPFQCESCDYASGSSDNLRAHKLCRHSVVGTFMCRECKKCFKTAEYGKIHYKRIHFACEFTSDSIVQIA